MKTIYKYPIETTDRQTILLPRNAEILTIQIQNKTPVLYALIDLSDEIKTNRNIEIFGTGHPIYGTRETLQYIGTYQLYGDQLVFHAFERISQ